MVPLKVMPVGKGAAGENFEIFIGQSLSWTPTRQTAPPLTLRRSQRWGARIGYLLPASSKQTRVKFKGMREKRPRNAITKGCNVHNPYKHSSASRLQPLSWVL